MVQLIAKDTMTGSFGHFPAGSVIPHHRIPEPTLRSWYEDGLIFEKAEQADNFVDEAPDDNDNIDPELENVVPKNAKPPKLRTPRSPARRQPEPSASEEDLSSEPGQ